MTIRKIARGMGSLVIVFAFSSWLSAQTVEVNPYAGGLLAPSSVDIGTSSFELKEQGIYGIRAGIFLTEHIEVEGNFGYINPFEFEESDPESRTLFFLGDIQSSAGHPTRSVDVTIRALDSLTKRGRQMYDTLLKDTDLRREEL